MPSWRCSEGGWPLAARYGTGFGGLISGQFSDLTADRRTWNSHIVPGLLRAAP